MGLSLKPSIDTAPHARADVFFHSSSSHSSDLYHLSSLYLLDDILVISASSDSKSHLFGTWRSAGTAVPATLLSLSTGSGRYSRVLFFRLFSSALQLSAVTQDKETLLEHNFLALFES